ncbi:discoidin domain-containing protein [Cohnella silvisoli]|uniref:Discoidin domain-containing protein n=1 Tax=Cohnella silvisoli TaxID=2873699 RepID=A0ABV1KU81_9BACL|nr:discoidin domain-containing protein [Cohnella silvisoli]MCD9023235.1 discoidin domain-containing protein [Cohnella silvisoli]
MKRFKFTGMIFLSMLFIASTFSVIPPQGNVAQASSVSEKLLSDNPLGWLISTGTAKISTGASYSWLKEGQYASDPSIVSTDSTSPTHMQDGRSVPSNLYDNFGTFASGSDSYGTLVYDLKAVYRVSKVQVWATADSQHYMKQFEVMASEDGVNYRSVGVTLNTNGTTSGVGVTTLAIKPAVHARYVKVIAKKDTAQYQMILGEVAVWGDNTLKPMSLLSNTYLRASGTYNTSTPKITTNSTYRWISDKPFETDSQSIATDNDSKNDGAGGWPDLTDGDPLNTAGDYNLDSVWGYQGKYQQVIYDLKDIYAIGALDVWTYANSQHWMDGYEVQVSSDGAHYSTLGYTVNTNSRSAGTYVNTPSYGISGKNARYVKFILHNANDSYQLTTGEIAVWGWPLNDLTLPHNATPEKVEITTDVLTQSSITLDWTDYNQTVNDVGSYNLYIETSDFTSTVGKTPKMKYTEGMRETNGKAAIYTGLAPLQTYYIALAPVGKNGERTDVTTVKITTPAALGNPREKVGDIFAIDNYPYGGGGYIDHGEQEDIMLMKNLRYLSQLDGVYRTHWWQHWPWVLDLYGRYGVTFYGFANFNNENLASDNARGTYLWQAGDEPEFSGYTGATWASVVKTTHDVLKAANPNNMLTAPDVGGVNTTFINDFYNSDGQNGNLVKTYFDAFSLSAFVGYGDSVPAGLAGGVPEGLIQKVSDIRTIMTNHGDGNKPIVSVGTGWTTQSLPRTTWAIPVSQTVQRNYLVRTFLLSLGMDIKRIGWYAFQDSGTDPNDQETNFGIVDWNGNPKLAYYGYHLLIRELKTAKYLSAVAGISNPYYGYKFWSEQKNQYINTLWAADESTKTAHLSTTASSITVVNTDGSIQTLPVSGGIVNVTITGAPVFIHSDKDVTVTSIS